jgi:hypothetical protein
MNNKFFLSFVFLFLGGIALMGLAFVYPSKVNNFLTASLQFTPPTCPFHVGLTPNQVKTSSELSLRQEAILLKLFFTQAVLDSRGVAICKETDSLNTCLARFQNLCYQQGKCEEQYDGSTDATITSEIRAYLCTIWSQRYTKIFDSWTKVTSLFAQKNTSVPSWLTSARNSYLTWKNQQAITTTTTRISTSGGTGVSGTGETGYGMSQISGSTENLLGTFIDLNHPRLNLGAGTMEVYTKDTSLKEGKLICDGKQVGFGFNAQYWPGLWLQNMETENVRQDANCQLILTSSTGQTSSYGFKFGDVYGKGLIFTGFNQKSASLEGNSHFDNLNIITSNVNQNGQMILEFELQYLNGQNLNSYSKVEIKDANGKVIKTITYDEAKGWYNPISLSLPQGVYTINLYSGSNLIESRSIGLDSQGKLTSETKVLGATGWGSAFDPRQGGSGQCLNNNCSYTLTMQATGGTRYTIIDENGNLLYSAAIPPSGSIALQLSNYVGKNQKYYFVIYTTDENGNEIVASIQEGATDDKGFVDYLVVSNYKFSYGNCNGGYLSLPLQFRNDSTKITDSSGNPIPVSENGTIKKSDLTVGQTYTFTTVVNGQTITYTFTYNGWDNGPLITYGAPNIVQSGNNLKACPYVCVGSSLCDQLAAGYYCASGSVCCEKTHSIFTKDCPGQSGFVGYGCYNTEDCKGGSGIGYKCPDGQTCCKPGTTPPTEKGTCTNNSQCGGCELCNTTQGKCVPLECLPGETCNDHHGCDKGCSGNSECYACQICSGGTCVAVACGPNQVCDNNHGCKDQGVPPPPTGCDYSSDCGLCETCVANSCVAVTCGPNQVCDNNHGCKDQGVPPPPLYKYQCHDGGADWSCDPVVNAITGYSDISSCEEACKPQQPTTKNCSYKSCDGSNNCAPQLTTVDINAICPTNSCDVNSDCGSQPVPGCPATGCGDYMKCGPNNQCVDNCYGIACPAGTGCVSDPGGHHCQAGYYNIQ